MKMYCTQHAAVYHMDILKFLTENAYSFSCPQNQANCWRDA